MMNRLLYINIRSVGGLLLVWSQILDLVFFQLQMNYGSSTDALAYPYLELPLLEMNVE